ncbi:MULTISPECIES: hypothetical protein [unclassified Streptomyces]|uniref:hypothetical protein n=1 Tax=unclassified Streptomyces TaxID=2593676 RepID=UPI0022B6EBDA|nr:MULTISPECIES: hypothetical protein [unclassified Streptomyces]MCZ7417612.1 hypothetical protein [Streptomyces sp. WMMC897]MCZ7432578.1 hypothetical protein [Streptomyces sp. WMMC1477]
MTGGYLRFQCTTPNARGVLPGIFVTVNGLAREGRLTAEQDEFRRTTNAWYDAAYTNPTHVDPTVYDHAVNPGAVAWFKPTAGHLLARIDGYLDILAAHGVPYVHLESADPGRVVYEDAHQIVVVPRPEV